MAEAAFFFPKLCFAPREGENAANLRRSIKMKWRFAPFLPASMFPYHSAANGLTPYTTAWVAGIFCEINHGVIPQPAKVWYDARDGAAGAANLYKGACR